MSTISAGTTTNTALQSTGDTTGNLVLQTNGTTTALTLNTSQALGVGSSPSYGTAGQVLTSGGSGASPTWATPATGAMTLISTLTASSSASLAWTGLSVYDKYRIIFNNLLPASIQSLYLLLGTGAGPTYLSTNYFYEGYNAQTGAGNSAFYTGVAQQSQFLLSSKINITTGYGTSGYIDLSGCLTTITANVNAFATVNVASGPDTFATTASTGGVVSGAQITAIKLNFASGNITSGTASLYGISS